MTNWYRQSKFQIKIIHLDDSDMYFYFPEVKEKNDLSYSLPEIPSRLNLCSVHIMMQLKPSQVTLLILPSV